MTCDDAWRVSPCDGGLRAGLLWIGSAALLSLACGPPPAATLTVSAPATTLERGQEIQLSAAAADEAGKPIPDAAVTWTSSDSSVVEIDQAGNATARARGTATITAQSGAASDAVELTVIVLYESIELGAASSCDIGSGTASCWGDNGFGVLGDGTQTDSTQPVDVAGGLTFAQVTAAALHTCGITEAGEAYCWGSNSAGQGGTGDLQGPNETPVKVAGTQVFASISAGADHTCALTTGGEAYCWGANEFGQLGIAATDSQVPDPTAVQGGLTFSVLRAGVHATCGITVDRAAYCWGSDSSGELGNGGPISGQTTDFSRVPLEVAGGLQWSAIDVGQFFACGITTAGQTYCWGRNDVGRLGDGSTTDSSSPVELASAETFAQLDTGYTHSCAVTAAGAAYCWGANNSGELGVEAPADLSRVPVQVGGSGSWSEVAAGENAGSAHSCGISRDRLSVRCWGRNDVGQLGNGGTTLARTPTPVEVFGQQP